MQCFMDATGSLHPNRWQNAPKCVTDFVLESAAGINRGIPGRNGQESARVFLWRTKVYILRGNIINDAQKR